MLVKVANFGMNKISRNAYCFTAVKLGMFQFSKVSILHPALTAHGSLDLKQEMQIQIQIRFYTKACINCLFFYGQEKKRLQVYRRCKVSMKSCCRDRYTLSMKIWL
jgi:hypothetical protein